MPAFTASFPHASEAPRAGSTARASRPAERKTAASGLRAGDVRGPVARTGARGPGATQRRPLLRHSEERSRAELLDVPEAVLKGEDVAVRGRSAREPRAPRGRSARPSRGRGRDPRRRAASRGARPSRRQLSSAPGVSTTMPPRRDRVDPFRPGSDERDLRRRARGAPRRNRRALPFRGRGSASPQCAVSPSHSRAIARKTSSSSACAWAGSGKRLVRTSST